MIRSLVCREYSCRLLTHAKVRLAPVAKVAIRRLTMGDRQPFDTNLVRSCVFKGKSDYMHESFNHCEKHRLIDLLSEGFSEYVLDCAQPIVKISEYYSCASLDFEAVYSNEISLLDENRDTLKSCKYRKVMSDVEDRKDWHKFETELKNYGPGLRYIRFVHTGKDHRWHSVYFSCKMKEACVKLIQPE